MNNTKLSPPDKPKRIQIYKSDQILEDICKGIAGGKSLITICKDPAMPHIDNVRRWLLADDKFKEMYNRARDEQADFYADEIIEISDGHYETPTEVQQARLKVDARKWIASKLKPKKYGDRVDLTSDGEKIEPLVIYRPTKLPNVIDVTENEESLKIEAKINR
jgi:hypothetical protein